MTMNSIIERLSLQERAHESLKQVIAHGGSLMAKEPWRIARAIGRSYTHWPIEGMSPFDIEAEVDRKIRDESLREGHWTFSMSRLIELKQAKKALEIMYG